MKILISDSMAMEGVELIRQTGVIEADNRPGLPPDELLRIIGDYDGLIIRSATKVTAEVIESAGKLKVVGRGGIGLDNVDIPAATKKGVVVMNTPEGNAVTTAEHAISMLLALSRNIPQATASMKNGKWEKKKFQGKEVFNKTLGVVGLGKIGSIVANRALGLKMRVIASDPYLKPESAASMGLQLVTMDQLLQESDYVTLHVPRTPQTVNLIDREALSKMKPGAMIINCARGGIVNEEALIEALRSGRLRGAALDVFVAEPPVGSPLLDLENVICTPHLGASTEEAQRNVSIGIAEQMVDYLINGTVKNAVNVPSVSGELLAKIKPYVDLCEKLGRVLSALAPGALSTVEITYRGKVSEMQKDPLTTAVLMGLLFPRLRGAVNFVNAPVIAKERGIDVIEKRSDTAEDFLDLITVRVEEDGNQHLVAGTLFGKKEPRLVRIDGFTLEADPQGHLLFIKSHDSPGVIGRIGTYLGNHSVNINNIHVSQDLVQRMNVILIQTNRSLNGEILEGLKALEDVVTALTMEL
ncbi:MAG: phosphoglycerate dehydrogenase [Deltaproteobacteria bacterium]|nr:phosphoglycerate dehydrogenase [Deltaproteobacteria bacterium]